MKKLYTMVMVTAVAAAMAMTAGFMGGTGYQLQEEVWQVTDGNGDCDGSQDRAQDRERLKDGSCQELTSASGWKLLATLGDQEPDRIQDRRRDESCQDG